jgi:hypothetical protein
MLMAVVFPGTAPPIVSVPVCVVGALAAIVPVPPATMVNVVTLAEAAGIVRVMLAELPPVFMLQSRCIVT